MGNLYYFNFNVHWINSDVFEPEPLLKIAQKHLKEILSSNNYKKIGISISGKAYN